MSIEDQANRIQSAMSPLIDVQLGRQDVLVKYDFIRHVKEFGLEVGADAAALYLEKMVGENKSVYLGDYESYASTMAIHQSREEYVRGIEWLRGKMEERGFGE